MLVAGSMHYAVLVLFFVFLVLCLDKSKKLLSNIVILMMLGAVCMRFIMIYLLPHLSPYYNDVFFSHVGGGFGMRWVPEVLILFYCISCSKYLGDEREKRFVIMSLKLYLITLALSLSFFDVPLMARFRLASWVEVLACIALLWSKKIFSNQGKVLVLGYGGVLFVFQSIAAFLFWHQEMPAD